VAEVELYVELLFEEVGTAFGIAKIFGDIAASVDFEGDGTALEGSAHGLDTLAMRVVEALGNANERGKTACDAFVAIVEDGVGGMVSIGSGFAVVIAHDGADEVAISALESRDIAVEGEVFAVFVMRAVADAVTNVVEECACFELNTPLRWKMVNRLQLIEEHQAEFADVFGVLLIVLEATAKTASGEKHLTRSGIVAVRFLAGESLARDFREQTFADADTRNDKAANVQITAKGEKDDGGDAHDVGAVAANSIGLHACAEVAFEEVGKAFAKEREFESGKAVLTRTRSNVGESFGVAAESHGNFIGEIGALRDAGLEKSANIAANLFDLKGTNDAMDVEGGEQPNGADGKLRAGQNRVVAKDAEFQAPAAEVDDATRLSFRAHGGDDRFAAETRFFLGAYDFQRDASGLLDATDKILAIQCFAGGAGGDGAIFGDAVFLHKFTELTEGFDAFFEDVFAEAMADKDAFAEAQGVALVDEGFDIEGGIDASDREADCVGAGIDGGYVDRFWHEGP
jgi:hypothetical protein